MNAILEILNRLQRPLWQDWIIFHVFLHVWFWARLVNAILDRLQRPRSQDWIIFRLFLQACGFWHDRWTQFLASLDQDSFGLSACHDFTRFFKLFDHCFDFLTQIRRHAVHLIMGAEKETEEDSAVANTDLVTRRPAKLRLRAPSKTKQTMLRVCWPRRSHGVTCIRKWNKYLLRLSRLRNWKL